MKVIIFYMLFGLLSVNLQATDNRDATGQQPFSKAHAPDVTTNEPDHLADMDVSHPLFIFR